MSIVISDLGTDQGCNSIIEVELTFEALIVLRDILPSIVNVFPSAIPGFGVIKSKFPSLSKSAIVELSNAIWPWKLITSQSVPSFILKA